MDHSGWAEQKDQTYIVDFGLQERILDVPRRGQKGEHESHEFQFSRQLEFIRCRPTSEANSVKLYRDKRRGRLLRTGQRKTDSSRYLQLYTPAEP